ncbi:MAG: YncE family protein [Candidatus Sericytochromatia bacterium]
MIGSAVGALGVIAVTLAACSNDSVSSDTTISGSVWVADQGQDGLSVLDAATNTVTTTLTGLPGPHNVQVGRDGSTVYAVSSANAVVAIDAATYAVRATATTGSEPAHVIEAPNGKVYVTNAGDGSVSVYRAPGLQATGRVELGGMPHGLRAAADGSIIVVANTSTGELNVIDPATDQPRGAVPVGKGPVQVAVTADGRYAYSGITDPPSVMKVDLRSRTVVGNARVSAAPVQLYLTPNETTVVSADQDTATPPGTRYRQSTPRA